MAAQIFILRSPEKKTHTEEECRIIARKRTKLMAWG